MRSDFIQWAEGTFYSQQINCKQVLLSSDPSLLSAHRIGHTGHDMAENTDTVNAIAALTPLKILIVAEKEKTITSEPGRSLVRAIQRAFQGGQSWARDGSENTTRLVMN